MSSRWHESALTQLTRVRTGLLLYRPACLFCRRLYTHVQNAHGCSTPATRSRNEKKRSVCTNHWHFREICFQSFETSDNFKRLVLLYKDCATLLRHLCVELCVHAIHASVFSHRIFKRDESCAAKAT